MLSFTRHVPTTVIFGKNTIVEIVKRKLIPDGVPVMLMTSSGASADRCGAIAQLRSAGVSFAAEFRSVEPNPSSETCAAAASLALKHGVGFIVAVGGNSVIDAAKFTSAAMEWIQKARSPDVFDILVHWSQFEADFEPRPIARVGAVLTLPAGSSEVNSSCVITHRGERKKLTLTHDSLFPAWAILDPLLTFSLPRELVASGIADAFVHVLEQYTGHPPGISCSLQDRQAEAVLQTLIEVARPAMEPSPPKYESRATLMWTINQAQDGLLGCGVEMDWASHQIGHELTAFYNVRHSHSVAILMPAVLRFERESRAEKLSQMARRVFGCSGAGDLSEVAIAKVVEFLVSLGIPAKLSEAVHGATDQHFAAIADRFEFALLGTECNIGKDQVLEILRAIL